MMGRPRGRLLAIVAGAACVLVLAYFAAGFPRRIEERRLLGKLDEGSDEVCAETVDALLALGPGVFPAIIDCLRTGSSKRRLWCLHAVEEAGMQELLPRDLLDEVGEAMIRCAWDPAEEVREQLAQVANSVSLTHLPSFPGMLESMNEEVRIAGYYILSQDVDATDTAPRSMEPLLPLLFTGLKDQSIVVRVCAAKVLGKCDWAAATVVPALMAAYTREAARRAAPGDPPPEGLEDLEDGQVCSLFLQFLGQMGPQARMAVPLLLQVLETRPSELETSSALDALVGIRVIGQAGVAALEKAASSGDAGIRRDAERALEEVSAEEE